MRRSARTPPWGSQEPGVLGTGARMWWGLWGLFGGGPAVMVGAFRLIGQPFKRKEAMAKIDDLLNKVDSKYTLVHLSATRAREINDYYHSLGDGMGLYLRPLVECSSNKPLSIAFEEIAAGKIVVQRGGEGRAGIEDFFDQVDDNGESPIIG